MAYESIVLFLTTVSSIAILPGIYYAYRLARKTGNTSSVPYFLLFAFLTLFIYQAAEALEFVGKIAHSGEGEYLSGVHTALEGIVGMELEEFAEGFAHTMPVTYAAIFLYIAYLARKSPQLPL